VMFHPHKRSVKKKYTVVYLCVCYHVYVCVLPSCAVVYVCMHICMRCRACIFVELSCMCICMYVCAVVQVCMHVALSSNVWLRRWLSKQENLAQYYVTVAFGMFRWVFSVCFVGYVSMFRWVWEVRIHAVRQELCQDDRKIT
jgi:hypothetical protein